MPNSIRIALAPLLILVFANVTHADVVTVEVTITSVDAKDRTITATRKDKTLKLDVSKKAEVIINGKAGELAALAAGQIAKIDYETTLEIITKIEATGEGLPTSEFVVLREINTQYHDRTPWLSPDGLTIYWAIKHPTEAMWIWSAKRKDADSLFEDKNRLVPGSDPTLTGDGLEMILFQSGKLYSAERDTVVVERLSHCVRYR